jgi:hypothetical protein
MVCRLPENARGFLFLQPELLAAPQQIQFIP